MFGHLLCFSVGEFPLPSLPSLPSLTSCSSGLFYFSCDHLRQVVVVVVMLLPHQTAQEIDH
jgi:hypothetical protein